MAREYLVVYRSLVEFDRHSPTQDEKLVAAGGGVQKTTKRDKARAPAPAQRLRRIPDIVAGEPHP